MKKLTLLIIPILALLFASNAVLAAAGDHNVRFGFKYIMPTGDLEWSDEYVDMGLIYRSEGTVEADAALGLGVGYEYMFTDLFGLDFNLNYASHDINDKGSEEIIDVDVIIETYSWDEKVGDTTVMPITVGANFHVYRSEALEFYLGPFVGYVMYDDIDLDDDGKIKLKSDFGYGMAFGLDVPFGGKGWMFSTVLKYMQTAAEVDEHHAGDEIDINPVILQVGFGYKF